MRQSNEKRRTEERQNAPTGRVNSGIVETDAKLRVHEQVQRSVKELIRIAEHGDELSIMLLLMIAAQTADAINSGVKQWPELFIKFSRNLFVWPAFISRKRAIKLANEKLMKTLQLGEGHAYLTNKEWRLSAPSTQAAIGLFLTALVRRDAWKLPPLTEQTKRIWFETSWDDMLRRGPAPEQVPKLAKLGKSAIGKKSISRGMPEQTERMKRDDARAEIKRQIWNAFNRLVGSAESE